MQRSKPPAPSIYEIRRILNPVRKWRVSTGALLGAAVLSGIELTWRGFAVEWDFLSDRAHELITLEILVPGIVLGAVCGALICLIRNQQTSAANSRE